MFLRTMRGVSPWWCGCMSDMGQGQFDNFKENQWTFGSPGTLEMMRYWRWRLSSPPSGMRLSPPGMWVEEELFDHVILSYTRMGRAAWLGRRLLLSKTGGWTWTSQRRNFSPSNDWVKCSSLRGVLRKHLSDPEDGRGWKWDKDGKNVCHLFSKIQTSKYLYSLFNNNKSSILRIELD